MISKRIQLWVLAFFINLKCITASETYKSIMWDPQNPLFIEGKFNCDPAYKHKLLKIRSTSKIKFICPNVATVLQTTKSEVSKSNKYENLWLLYDRASFDKCNTKLNPENMKQPLLRCTEPTELEFHSITFQKFAAEPNELTFQKGRSYFFIATSNGLISHINDTSGGHCNDTANKVYMKIEVYVCNNTGLDEDPKCNGTIVGELVCPEENTVSSSTTSTPAPSSPHVTISSTPSGVGAVSTVIHTTATTVTTTTTASLTDPRNETNETQNQDGPLNKDTRKGDSNTDREKAWMVATLVLLFVCIVLVVGFIIFHFFCGGRKKCHNYEHRVSPELGKKNHGFKHDSLDNKPSISLQGSLPDKDVIIHNFGKEVFYNNTVTVDEENKKNAPT